MKTPNDPRHRKRQRLVQELFMIDFHNQAISKETKAILTQKARIDECIRIAAPQFPIDKINKTDIAILRLAVHELIVEKKEPPKVIIDEAIELAKEFGGETSPAFINGALGNIISHEASSIVSQ